MPKPTILVTGGAGYIGSHTTLELLLAGFTVVIVDNLCNSSVAVVRRLRELAGPEAPELHFIQADILDRSALDKAFAAHQPHAVIHFAGLKAVGESTRDPLTYYDVNVGGSIQLIRAMQKAGCHRLVFSSSASVYGSTPKIQPIPEHLAPSPSIASPYGKTKAHVEDLLQDWVASDAQVGVTLLRYFNPIGAHPSGQIGEDPKGTPNNLMPYLAQVATQTRPYLPVFGDSYATSDGTCIRDYLHVVDLALGHLAALRDLQLGVCEAYNLGTGCGTSVLELIHLMSETVGRELPYRILPMRPGDVKELRADPSKAQAKLGWVAHRTVKEMCEDTWKWRTLNPHGYETTGNAHEH
ncbi:UDP-D-glucose/UDP-D-galactose 4-epimerase 5 [Piptocephalis cylindrospora]|uniref:UDP-glucose 4-epimerase n=1 Tax=Piptocephalis cylindrospora TaxID=1907219 RepID=A0A4P9Y2I0_9FUNG|nr:UDP-D-glucose/UDP-D-galactose 4-epimerase 5 [Piptocephalis cylindrospora]|eukprot:RKP13035.1 UDP-D-glucose/UDP-D-galactose 4-epimerase 5 [Piptocephalis cylindrospora]